MKTIDHYDANARSHAVLIAFAAGELSEGQAAKLLGIDRINLRERQEDYTRAAAELWGRFKDNGLTVASDIADEVAGRQRQTCRCSD